MERTDHLGSTGDLGGRIAADGVAAHLHAITRLVRRARRLGVAGVAVDVLADEAAPDVVRQRAFARVSRAVAAGSGAAGQGFSRVA